MPTSLAVSILLVDDAPRNLVALEAALGSVDCRLVKAPSGHAALKLLLTEDFAVIVLDIRMPGMDGFETAGLIRARERSRLTPIIFLTADDRVGAPVLEGYRLGAIDYMYKPFDPAILRAKVAIFVELFRQTTALKQRTAELTTMAARLERSEDHFRALIENTSDLTLIVEDDGIIRYASPSVERTLGYSREQLSGQPLAELLHPDDVATLHSGTALLLKTGAASPPTGHRWRHADGSYRLLESTASNLLRTISVAGLVVHARDMTERNHAAEQVRRLNAELEGRVVERTAAISSLEAEVVERLRIEETLRASEERFRRQYKGFPLPTYSWLRIADDFVLQDFNDAAEATSAGEIGAWLGSRASDRFLDHPEVLVDLQACVSEERLIRRELRYRYSMGDLERQLVFSYVFVPPLTVMVHTEDVTEARHAEQQRKAMAQSEKLRAVGQMASGIAHDLNQSLMLVASYSELARQALIENPPNLAELEDLLTTTTQAALDGGETVKRLLLFTRAAPEHESRVVDLGDVARDASRLTAPRWHDAARTAGHPISLHVEAVGHPTVQGSPAQLREVMTNVIFNAVDALPIGGTIRVQVLAEHGQGIIEVTDSGVGMSAEVQERVFEPFFTTKGESGTGLGLAMVFRTVEQHRGRITVRSAPGAGTTFRISFPLVDVVAEPAPTPPPAVLVESPRSLRVLVVDDEPMMTRAVVRMLKPAGHVVSEAGSGEEALRQLVQQTFDVVVSDMGMGAGMTGLQLADAVKRRWPEVRFLLATGWGAAIDPGEAQSNGVESVLSKPYHPADLIRALASPDKAA